MDEARVGMSVQNDTRDTLGMFGATISVRWKDWKKHEVDVERASTVFGSGPLKDTTVVHGTEDVIGNSITYTEHVKPYVLRPTLYHG